MLVDQVPQQLERLLSAFNCTVTKIVDGLINSPTAMWIIPSDRHDGSISLLAKTDSIVGKVHNSRKQQNEYQLTCSWPNA